MSNPVVPLGYTQLCFWFMYAALGETVNILLRLKIDGDLSVKGLEHALDQLVRRHESLRVRISDWNPVQMITEAKPLDLTFEDASALSETERKTILEQASRELLTRRFDLSTPPLLRAQLIRLESRTHLLLLALPHIVADGGAAYLLQRELVTMYERYVSGHAGAGLAPPLQISEFVSRERERNHGLGREAEAFWRKQLANFSYARFPDRDLAFGKVMRLDYHVEFPGGSFAALRRLATIHKATLQMCLLTVIGMAVYRMTGQRRFVVNSVLESREDAATEGLMAPLLRVMPVPFECGHDMDFEAMLASVRRNVIASYEHKDCPWSIPLGVLAEQRWHASSRVLARGIVLLSKLFTAVFRRARLYPRFLADFLFMEPSPPTSLLAALLNRGSSGAQTDLIAAPVINLNVLQGVFRRAPPMAGQHSIAVSTLNERREQRAQSGTDTWENDSLNIYIKQAEGDKPSICIVGCCLSEAGMARLRDSLVESLLRAVRHESLALDEPA